MATIKELRIAKNLTQEELAQRAIVSYATISRVENNKPISKASLKLICLALGVNESDVTGVVMAQPKRNLR